MTIRIKKSLQTWLLFAVGALLVLQFAGLSVWQINRGLEKQSQRDRLSDETGFSAWSDGMQIRSYQRLKATGIYDSGHQFLVGTIILNSRPGFYVLTPLDAGDDQPLLLVNRGWVEKTSRPFDASLVSVDAATVTVRGRAGSLPTAGYRKGDAIAPGALWPQYAVYPTLDDLAVAIERDVQPFVLLMDPHDAGGFFRHWTDEEMGPSKHFAYALQWFAMGALLAGMLLWNYRRERTRSE